MIQRIQTLYLLLAVALTACAVFLPLACFSSPETGELRLFAFSMQGVDGLLIHRTLYLGLLLAATSLLPLATIFCFRNRMLQIRLCCMEFVLLLGVAIMEGVYYYLGYRLVADAALHAQGFKFAAALPLLALLFVFLAAKAIFRDEVLVRSVDRIR